ncbi:MAG: phosphatase PAP2 family protein [Spirochaetaceae bacterium]|jgi:membrane-associated phospholipid phosphatase|nr:phosphatase PAP2 family protein [Spirochaetaceae bacterium]
MENTGAFLTLAEPSLLSRIQWHGIDLIRLIQRAESPALTTLMRWITELGAAPLYLAVIMLMYWCVDEKRGFRLALLVITSAFFNGAAKRAFAQTRPYRLAPDVGRAVEDSYGFPSGHAQSALVFWAALAPRRGTRRGGIVMRLAAVFFVLLIAFTRLYLGVHFPTDILGGWLLGGAVLGLFTVFEPRLTAFLRERGIRSQLLAAAAAAFLMNAAGHEENLGGLFFGFCAGHILNLHRIGFSARTLPSGSGAATRLLRYFLGAAGVISVQFLLRAVLPGEGSLFRAAAFWGAASPLARLSRFLRYGGMGFSVSAILPFLFIRFGMAGRPAPGAPASEEPPESPQ